MKKYVFEFYDWFLEKNRILFIESNQSPKTLLEDVSSQLGKQRVYKSSLFSAADPDEVLKIGNLEVKSSGFPKELKSNSFKITDYETFFERNKNKELP